MFTFVYNFVRELGNYMVLLRYSQSLQARILSDEAL